jgi:arabinose-5-phosphate isomerase
MKHTGENVVRIEAEALRALADRIGGPMARAFQCAVELLFCCAGRVVVTGMGKSGLIARKIAATLSSTGTPALYLHPVDALHGDLGMVVRGDVVLALSASGETEEILQLLATIKRLRVPLIVMTGDEICATPALLPAPHRQFQLWRRRPMWLWIVRLPRRLARSGWLRPRLPPPCWRWGMRWR